MCVCGGVGTMSYIEIDGLILDEATGEIIDAPTGEDSTGALVFRLVGAKEQKKAWERDIAIYQGMVLKRQPEPREQYGDIIATKSTRTTAATDTEAFASMCSELPLEAEDLWTIIAAAKGFDRDKLPEKARQAFDECTEMKVSAPWVDTRVVKHRAPVPKAVEA